MATVLVLLDAFRHDYLSPTRTPFLWQCARRGRHYQRVVPAFGFCERAEILCGLPAEQNGLLTAIGFDPSESPYRDSRGLALLDVAERSVVTGLRLLGDRWAARGHRKWRRMVDRRHRRRGIAMSSQMNPFPWLRHFALTEDRVDHRSREEFERPSLLARLHQQGRPYYYDSFTALNFPSPFRSDDERLEGAVQAAATRDHALYLIYVAATDRVGHRYGPDTEPMREAVSDLDRRLERFVKRMDAQGGPHHYVMLGDHGMLPVTQTVDAEHALHQCIREVGLRRGRDVLYSLDSTMVRVWALRPDKEDAIRRAIACSPLLRRHGMLINGPLARRLKLPWPDRRYGDVLWMANPGVLVFPDFFHRLDPSLGMHGYDPRWDASQGMCVEFGPGVEPGVVSRIELCDVHGVRSVSRRHLVGGRTVLARTAREPSSRAAYADHSWRTVGRAQHGNRRIRIGCCSVH